MATVVETATASTVTGQYCICYTDASLAIQPCNHTACLNCLERWPHTPSGRRCFYCRRGPYLLSTIFKHSQPLICEDKGMWISMKARRNVVSTYVYDTLLRKISYDARTGRVDSLLPTKHQLSAKKALATLLDIYRKFHGIPCDDKTLAGQIRIARVFEEWADDFKENYSSIAAASRSPDATDFLLKALDSTRRHHANKIYAVQEAQLVKAIKLAAVQTPKMRLLDIAKRRELVRKFPSLPLRF